MDNRFEIVKQEVLPAKDWNVELYVLRDKQTGVMYLAERIANSGGLTPLLDRDGKPLSTFKVSL
jgi:hypothetical protein